MDDVEIGQGRFDHDDVGPFVEVEVDFLQGFTAVGRIHLIAPAVAEVRCRIGSVAEGTVIGRGVFGGVGHDADIR